jgi:hypothetical protein
LNESKSFLACATLKIGGITIIAIEKASVNERILRKSSLNNISANN